MAQVTLQINGYGYILVCADGEEDHLRMLAADLDRRIEEIKGATGPSGEARMLLMAALVISDELHDLRQRQDSAQQPASATPTSQADPKVGRRLRGLAKRAESIADQAEAPPVPPDGKAPSSAEPSAETTTSHAENIAATSEQP